MNEKRILVAEDEKSIRDFIVINLRRNGYDVYEAEDGEQALRIYEEYNGAFDVALLDIMMPHVDGLEVCKQLRQKSQTLGIVMLTAKTQEMDKVTGLLVGADDYITKPFSPSELMARIDAIYRRVAINKSSQQGAAKKVETITLGEFILSLRNRNLTKNGEILELTQVEFMIMEFFFKNPGVALDRNEILNYVWGSSYYGDDKVVDVNIRRLRMKLEDVPSEPKHLITVWGLGYKWVV
ncbi:MAG: response regulator transcription factor [Oscillospiraceae bacterium]|nr:response regulator transcription factor [Oscillospiraceae bacterium]